MGVGGMNSRDNEILLEAIYALAAAPDRLEKAGISLDELFDLGGRLYISDQI